MSSRIVGDLLAATICACPSIPFAAFANVAYDGFFVPEKLLFYTAMARDAGWGKDIPDMLRNSDWNYAVFTTDKQHRAGANQAECLACHKPLDKVSYLFTLKELAAAK